MPADRRFVVRQCSAVIAGRAALLVSLLTAALVACGGEAPSAERFCGEILVNREELTNPEITDQGDIDSLLGLYRDIASLAPLAIEDEWNQIVTAYETASTVVIGDEDSEQAALASIYASEEAASAVQQWLSNNCAVEIGPVFTIVPPGPADSTVPSTTTP